MARDYMNFYSTQLTAAVLVGDDTLSVGTDPDVLASGDYYRLRISEKDESGNILKHEFVDWQSDGTVTRAAEDSTPQAFGIGDWVEIVETAGSFKKLDGVEIKRFAETIATGVTAAIDRADGGIQPLTLTADSAITWTLNDGEKVQLYLTPSGFNVTDWGVDYWMTDVPTLTTQNMVIVERVGGNVYAWEGGSRT